MKNIVLAIVSTILICSCVSAPKAQRVMLIHQVRPGETVSGIYRANRIPLNCPYVPYRHNNLIIAGEWMTVLCPY